MTHIFNNYISGNVGNLASGQNIHQTATVNVNQGDFKSLTAYLETKGIKADDLSELKTALAADGKPTEKGFGKSVSTWLGKMVGKAASGSWEIATGTAAGVITEALKSYYGI